MIKSNIQTSSKKNFFYVKFLTGMAVLLILTGCCTDPPVSVRDREDRDRRMRQMLAETSPRALNQQPKAIPEFKSRFRTSNGDCDVCPEE